MNGVFQRLQTACRRRRVPHGLLFVGPGEKEKNTAADYLSQLLLCQAAPTAAPCGTCMACQKLAGEVHPDLRRVRPEKQEITVGQIRDLKKWLAIGPFESTFKVGIVEQAQTLNAASQNAFLKSLEEPPPHAVLVLMASRPDQLLPTVVSRLQTFRFPLSQSPSDLENVETPAWHQDFLALLKQPRPVSPETVFSVTERAASTKEDLPLFFSTAQNTLRDEIERAQETNQSVGPLDRCFELSLRLEENILRRYGNPALALDHLLLDWLCTDAGIGINQTHE